MDKRSRYIPAIVMLSAGFIACVMTIVQDYSTKNILLISTGAMVIFLIVGFIIKMIVDKFIFTSTIEEVKNDNIEADSEQTENEDKKEEETEANK